MSEFWLRPLAQLVTLGLAALLVWPLAGGTWALAVLVLGLLAAVVAHSRHLSELARWLADPRLDAVPEARGVWGEVFARLYHMARRQSRSRQQLSEILVRFRRAGEAMPDGVVILDEEDQIEWFNPVAGRQLGLDPSRDAGRPLTYLLRQAQFQEYLAAQNYAEPLIMRSSRNPEVTLSIQLVPFGAKQKLLIARDITRFERLETVRRDFVANVSHELRTPLTVLAGFLETLHDAPDLPEAERRRYIALMLEQASRMQRLVDDLLVLSRLESAATPLAEGDVDVPALVRRLGEEAAGLSRGRHEIVVDASSDAHLLGAEAELYSAFGNLVSNAVRYTPAGGRIVLSWKVDPEGARFSVSDTGIGIQAEHLPRLTERFYRVDRSRSRETGGTGLGLSIVKHVLTRHQARLLVESEVGRGSTFTAVFPKSRVIETA